MEKKGLFVVAVLAITLSSNVFASVVKKSRSDIYG